MDNQCLLGQCVCTVNPSRPVTQSSGDLHISGQCCPCERGKDRLESAEASS